MTTLRQVLRIKLFSYDFRLLDKATFDIVDIARRTGAAVIGPVPLPLRIKKFTVNRSTNIDKKSREQFEMRCHKRLVLLKESTATTMDSLMELELPSGIEIEIKLV